MSELVTNFVFDLQRFASTTSLQLGWGADSVKKAITSIEGGWGSVSSLNASIISKHYFWAEGDDSIQIGGGNKVSVYAAANYSSGTTEPYDYVNSKGSVESHKGETYYTVSLSQLTKLTGLAGVTGISLGSDGAQFAVIGNSTLSSAEEITLKDGNFTNIKLATKGVGISVAPDTALDGDYLTINGGGVNVDGGFGYVWNSKTDQILIFDGNNQDAAVNAVGNATRLSLAAATTYGEESVISILGKEYQVGATNSYFNLSKGALTGFTFADTVGASIGGAIGDTSLKLYYNNKASVASSQQELSAVPTFSGSGSYILMGTVGGAAGGSPSMQAGVTDGATVTFANGAIGVAGVTSLGSDLFDFNKDGKLTKITGFQDTGEQLTFSGFKATGKTVSKGAVSIVGAGGTPGSLLAVGSGDFVYGQSEESSVTTITLKQATDTVWAGGLASIVAPTSGEGTLYFFGTADKNKYQFVNTSGAANFSLANATSLAAFTFGGEKDALTMNGKSDSIALQYLDANEATQALPPATVELKDKKNSYTYTYTDEDTATFEVSGLDAGAYVSVGGGKFTFSDVAGGVLSFDSVGAKSVSIADGGKIVFDATAASSLATADDDSSPSSYFQINGKGVHIAFTDTTGISKLTYDTSTKALTGLNSLGAAITEAGDIEKIYLAKGEEQEILFKAGEEDEANQQAFTVTAGEADKAFFNVSGASATGFTFTKVKDAITGNFEGLKLYDGADDTVGFGAPEITDADGEAVDDGTITKTKSGFQVVVETEGYNVKLDSGTNLDFATLGNSDGASVEFSSKGVLLGVNGLTEENDQLTVSEADGAVSIDSSVVEITGGEFTYRVGTDSDSGDTVAALVSLKPGSEVKQSTGINELWTAGGKDGNGTFKFGSASFAIAGVDNDTVEGEEGVMFKWDDTNKKATAIDSIDENTSVTGNFNGMSIAGGTEALNVTDGTYVLFGGGLSMSGLAAGGKVVAAGGVSDFLTNAAASAKFTVLGTELTVTDADGVTFKTDGASLTGIDSLAGSATGDFTGGLSVNSIKVEVTGDDAIKVVGNNEGVTEIHQLGGTGVEVVSAEGASLVGANEDGDFTFTFAGGTSFALEGNKEVETTFTFADGAVTAIDGLDDGEIVAGSFSTAIKVEGKAIEITGDNSVSIQGGASSAILGLTGGASVVQSGGVKFAVTDSEGQFTFKNGAFSIAGDKEVTFVLDADGNVTGINGVDDAATVSGALNGVAINEGDPFDIRDNENYSYSPNSGVSGVVDTDTVKSANGAKNVWVSGTDFTVTFENGAFSVAGETDGVNFLVKDTNIAIGVESLDAGATMAGDFTQLTSVNGVSFAVADSDNSVSIVGADGGIGQILGLTAEATVTDAGGASIAKTDKAGKFTFGGASGVSFETADDDEVAFGLNAETGAVETISELSGAVTGDFSNVTGINDKDFDVKDSDGVLTVYGNDSEDDLAKIAGVTGDATIGEVGSVSQVVTDSEGKFTFKNGSWSLADGATEVTFGLSASEVTAIDGLNGSATGGFSGIAVNGAEIDITDGDNILKVTGDGTKLTAIEEVDADAIITKAGGVEKLSVNGVGSYSFADSGEFKVAGDSSVTFLLNTESDAEVTGIENLSGNVTGDFSGISSVNGKTFEVVDADGVLTVYGDGSDITKITGVTGSASIGEVGSVSQILTDKAGEFAFTNGSWSVAGDDEVTFGMSASKVVSISELVGTVTGAFEDVTVNGKSFQISGDSSIALVGGASGVTAIEKLSDGAVINSAEGTLTAMTDTEGTFTFADGKTLQVLGDSAVVFNLKDGVLTAIDSVDKSVTLVGALNGVEINGSSSVFDVRDNDNLWYSQGTLSAVVDGNTIVSADGATTVQVATDGTFTFGNGAFEITGDQDGAAQFTVSDSSIATAIDGLDAGATVTGDLNGMSINGGEALVVENDDSFGAVAGDGELAKLINLSDGANVVNAGGASQFVTDAEGSYTILGTAMQIESDDEVTFTAGASGITAIDGLEGTAIGDFQNVIAVNTNDVQVLNDSVVAVSSDGAEVTAIAQVSDGATVAAVGGAVEVGTDTEGSFTFATGGDSQAFTVEDDSEVTFQLEDGVVVGVNELEEGKLTFDTNTTALTLNDDESFTIETSTNASFSIADNSVNYVTGVDGAIDGLVNATVVATGAMEVNGENIDVQDDDDFKVIVQDGEVVGLADISGGAKVNVAGVSIAVDSNGEFEIGGKQYNFNDSVDAAFNLATGEDGELTAVDAFAGEMVIAAPADQSLTVNGGELGFASTADSVTVNSDGSDITAVTGLVNNDAVYGDLGGASIAMEGSTASVRGEGSFLTVNDVTYELLNDENGIVVTGGREVTDLDESASLYVSEKGKYTVNGNSSDIDVEDTNMPIIGLDGATDAYIYDPANLIIRKGTPVSEIETMLGLPTEYEEAATFGGDDVNHETAGTEDDPLDSAGLSSMFAEQDLDQPAEIFATNDEKTAQDIPLAGTDFSKKVHLFRGDQNVTFNNAGGNLAVVEAESSGQKNITLGDMGDAVIMKADAGNGTAVDITGGLGDDSVVVQGSAPVNFDMSDGGADKVITFASSNARIALSGYDALANPNAGIHITERWKDLAAKITEGVLNFANGVMSIGNDANANAQIDLGANIVNLFNYLGQKQAVGFTNDAGGLVDASTAQDPMILIGNDKGQKSGNSTLLGGSGDDTAIAGGGDNIDLGAGNNEVRLQQDINRAGADITLAQGRTTITGFIGSFNAQHGDMIKTDLSNANVSFDGENVIIEGDGFYGVIADAITNGELVYDTATDVTESADLVESADSSSQSVLAAADGDYTNVLFNDDGVISKTAIAKEGGVIDVKLDFDARPNNFIGDDSGITFYDHTGEVLVNLAEGTGSIDTEAVSYSGINKVAAGAGQMTMIGGESNETLIAGQGNDSVWGAGGKNLLLGYNDVNNDKTGQTSFFVVAEKDGAANTIRGFNFVDDDSWNVNTNQITADKLDIQVQYDYIDAERDVDISGDDVVLFVNNRNKESSESVVIEGARGNNFVVSGNDIVNDVVAQVNTDSLVANKFANFFVATGKNATLTVGNDVDTANIYLDNKTPDGSDYLGDVPQFYGDIHVIDASGSNAKVELGGNLYDNTIIAGTGDASLWGGDGGNDLLVGGTGANTFFYNAGDGNDTITGANDGDVVDLTNVQLSDIVDANSAITSSGVELKFKDGGSLTVNSTADVAYKVGEDTYVVNDDRDGWTKK